jgi:hypothetical protein
MKIKSFICAIAVILFTTGCIPAVFIVGAGAAGATYSVTNDGVADTLSANPETVFETMLDVLKNERGVIRNSSISEGTIEAVLPAADVYVYITDEGLGKVRIVIKARKNLNLLPDKDTAVYIYKQFIRNF